jgi:hypothetical protein
MRKGKPQGLQWAATGEHEMAYFGCGILAAGKYKVILPKINAADSAFRRRVQPMHEA